MSLSNIRLLSLAVAAFVLFCGTSATMLAAPAAPSGLKIEFAYLADDFKYDPDNPEAAYHTELHWNSSAGAGSYNVYSKQVTQWGSGEGEFRLMATTSDEMIVVNDYIDIQGLAGEAYAFHVTAVDGEGESGASNSVSAVCGRPFGGDIGTYNGDGGSGIVTNPPSRAILGREYIYDVEVVANYSLHDDRGISYELVRGPEGMELDPTTGVVTWTPQTEGIFFVTVSASMEGNNDSDQQFWQVEVEPAGVTDVRESYGMDAQVSLFPNPSTSQVTVRFNALQGATTVSIRDAQGSELSSFVRQTQPGVNTVSIDLNGYASGAYFLRLESDDEIRTIPFNVVR